MKDYRAAYNALMNFYPFSLGNIDGEQWKVIDEHYQISSFGRVKSFWHGKAKILKPVVLPNGYLRISLIIGGEKKGGMIHRLVAENFLPNHDSNLVVNHIDGQKLNNHVSNLEWCTQQENVKHAVKRGLQGSGEESHKALLTNEQVEWCREVYKPCDKEFSGAALARKLNTTEMVIHKAVHGDCYKNAGGKAHKKRQKQGRVPDEIRAEIRELYIKGSKDFNVYTLAKKYGITPSAIHLIIREDENYKAEPRNKLTDDQVAQLRQMYIPNSPIYGAAAFGRLLGLNEATIRSVVQGKTYKQASGTIHKKARPMQRIPDDIRQQIRAEYVKGSKEFGSVALGKKYGVSCRSVLTIINEK